MKSIPAPELTYFEIGFAACVSLVLLLLFFYGPRGASDGDRRKGQKNGSGGSQRKRGGSSDDGALSRSVDADGTTSLSPPHGGTGNSKCRGDFPGSPSNREGKLENIQDNIGELPSFGGAADKSPTRSRSRSTASEYLRRRFAESWSSGSNAYSNAYSYAYSSSNRPRLESSGAISAVSANSENDGAASVDSDADASSMRTMESAGSAPTSATKRESTSATKSKRPTTGTTASSSNNNSSSSFTNLTSALAGAGSGAGDTKNPVEVSAEEVAHLRESNDRLSLYLSGTRGDMDYIMGDRVVVKKGRLFTLGGHRLLERAPRVKLRNFTLSRYHLWYTDSYGVKKDFDIRHCDIESKIVVGTRGVTEGQTLYAILLAASDCSLLLGASTEAYRDEWVDTLTMQQKLLSELEEELSGEEDNYHYKGLPSPAEQALMNPPLHPRIQAVITDTQTAMRRRLYSDQDEVEINPSKAGGGRRRGSLATRPNMAHIMSPMHEAMQTAAGGGGLDLDDLDGVGPSSPNAAAMNSPMSTGSVGAFSSFSSFQGVGAILESDDDESVWEAPISPTKR